MQWQTEKLVKLRNSLINLVFRFCTITRFVQLLQGNQIVEAKKPIYVLLYIGLTNESKKLHCISVYCAVCHLMFTVYMCQYTVAFCLPSTTTGVWLNLTLWPYFQASCGVFNEPKWLNDQEFTKLQTYSGVINNGFGGNLLKESFTFMVSSFQIENYLIALNSLSECNWINMYVLFLI